MFLNATADITTAIQLANDAGPNVVNPSVFHSKQLLDTIRVDGSQYVYFRLADVAPIQEKADELQIRRWSALQGHTIPLSEGIPPLSDKGSVEKYTMSAKQYGRYMEFTDKVDLNIVDPVIAHYTKEYSLVAMETLDLLARETLLSISQKFYAGSVANFEALTMTSKPSMTDLRLIVLSLKKALVKPRVNGRFHVIGSSEFYYDMISDPIVEKFMRINQSTKTMYDNGQLVPMFDMEFYETLCVPTSSEFTKALEGGNAVQARRMVQSDGSGGYTYTTVLATDHIGVTEVDVLGTVSGYVKDPRTGKDASYIPGQKVWNLTAWNAGDARETFYEFKVQHILVIGKDALTRTGLAGEDQVKMYVKAKGSAGVLDPIDQRQSIGFKINSVGFGSTRLEAVVDYICVPSQVNSI